MAQRLWGGFGDLGRLSGITALDSGPTPSGSIGQSLASSSTSSSSFDISYKRNRAPKVIFRQPRTGEETESEGYVMGDVLGSGSYGKVRVAADRSTGRVVAIKIINKRYLKRIRGGEESVKREIKAMKWLQAGGKKPHPNIVELIEVITVEEKDKIYMVLEMVTGGSVQQLLELAQERYPPGRLPLSQARKIFRQLIDGLDFIHSRRVVHRDIKPTNIMLTPELRVKISDFGVAEKLEATDPDVVTKFSGSPAFLPPEIASGKEGFAGTKIDIWAAGVTLFLMVTGTIPFEGNSVGELFDRIAQGQFEIPAVVEDANCRDLLQGMLRYKEEERLSLEQIRAHPWMKQEDVEDPKIPWVQQNADSEPLRRLWETLATSAQSSSPGPPPPPAGEGAGAGEAGGGARPGAEGEESSAQNLMKKPAQITKQVGQIFSSLFSSGGKDKEREREREKEKEKR